MRVPTLDAPQVAPTTPNVAVPQGGGTAGFDSLARAFGQIGQGAEVVARGVQASHEKAVAADVTDGETLLTKSITEQMHGNSTEGGDEPGYLSKQGRDALAASSDYMGRIEQARQKIADARGTDEAKKLFLMRTGLQVEHTRSAIESHAQQQRQVADIATLKAREDSALESIRLNLGNGEEVQRQAVALEGPIKALSLSPEDAQKNVEDWNRRVLSTQIDGVLDAGNWKAADLLLSDGVQGRLGKLGDEFAKRTGALRDSSQIEEWIGGLSRVSTLPNGQLDEGAIWAAVEKQSGDWQKKAEPLVAQHLAHARRAWDEDTKNLGRASYTMVNKEGWKSFVASPLSDQLNERNPALWDQLKNAEIRDLDRLERLSRIRLNNKGAIREQNTIDAIAKNEWERELLKNPKEADIDLFIATHKDVSDKMASELPNMQAKMSKLHDKGLMSDRAEFVKEATDAAAGFIAARVGSKKDKDAATLERQDFEAAAGRAYDAHVAQKDAAPTPKEMEDMRGQVVREYMSKGRTPLVPHTPEAGARAGEDIAKRINAASAPQQPAPGRQIPAPARQRAIDRIKQSGKPVTEDLIRQVYDYERQMAERASRKK